MKKYHKMMLLSLVSISIIMIGCGGGPSKKQIKQAVSESLEERVPTSLAQWLTGGEKAKVEEVRIIKVGKPQKEGSYKYWPVKVHAKGTCSVMFGGNRSFGGETEYYVMKDPYGKWVARPAGL